MSLGISYAGYRNGFPFPVEHVTGASESAAGVGSNTGFPIAMTLHHACEIYWRWRIINGDYTFYYDGATQVSTNTDYERIVDLLDPVLTNEGEIIRPRGWGNTSMYAEVLQMYNEYGSPLIRKYGTNYYPQFAFDDPAWFVSTIMTGSYVTHTATITMQDGTVYNFDVFNLPSLPDPLDSAVTLAITCSEYWGYSGKFDIATGALL